MRSFAFGHGHRFLILFLVVALSYSAPAAEKPARSRKFVAACGAVLSVVLYAAIPDAKLQAPRYVEVRSDEATEGPKAIEAYRAKLKPADYENGILFGEPRAVVLGIDIERPEITDLQLEPREKLWDRLTFTHRKTLPLEYRTKIRYSYLVTQNYRLNDGEPEEFSSVAKVVDFLPTGETLVQEARIGNRQAHVIRNFDPSPENARRAVEEIVGTLSKEDPTILKINPRVMRSESIDFVSVDGMKQFLVLTYLGTPNSQAPLVATAGLIKYRPGKKVGYLEMVSIQTAK